METIKSATSSCVSSPTSSITVPGGMVKIVIPDGKKLKRVITRQYATGHESASLKTAFGANVEGECLILSLYVDPVTGSTTVTYGMFEF